MAPFWSDVDIVQDGSVCYTVHEKGGGRASDELLRQISTFIVSQSDVGGETFDGIWMLVAQWEDVHMYPYTYISRYPQFYSKRQRDQLQAVRPDLYTIEAQPQLHMHRIGIVFAFMPNGSLLSSLYVSEVPPSIYTEVTTKVHQHFLECHIF